ncbi:hypothetical protein GCM10023084_69940 [Streptomyces lacrimifluminis]|uniref:LD-carboxypeptidase N-terminal domain-containing protein n=1 Tax=Streptomyces lacrimifluminis TaxID=1500077 RepID=A0A917P4T2_9ACTN|nr:hypothetical protein GCM10012282_68700 [Streptomyces lacrimifluminis]
MIAARGGKGAYRIVDDLDTDTLRRDPEPLVGFSDITHLHLALGPDAAWPACTAPSPPGATNGAGPHQPAPDHPDVLDASSATKTLHLTPTSLGEVLAEMAAEPARPMR